MMMPLPSEGHHLSYLTSASTIVVPPCILHFRCLTSPILHIILTTSHASTASLAS